MKHYKAFLASMDLVYKGCSKSDLINEPISPIWDIYDRFRIKVGCVVRIEGSAVSYRRLCKKLG